MPRCRYECATLGHVATANFATPKRVTELDRWLGAAANAVLAAVTKEGRPQYVPVREVRKTLVYDEGWTLHQHVDVSPSFIKFELVDRAGNRGTLVIDRKFDAYGR